MTDAPTKNQIAQARVAIALLVGLSIRGVAMYGVSEDDLGRIWHELAGSARAAR